MAIDEKAGSEARRKRALLDAGLTLLLDRAGGMLEFTEAEYQATLAKYGGASRMNLRFEVTRRSGSPDVILLRLEEKMSANAELVS